MSRKCLGSVSEESRKCLGSVYRLLPHLQAAAYPPPAATAGPADSGEAAAPRRRGLEGFAARHLKLSAAICELVDDFGLVGFGAVAVDDSETMARALRSIDKANGYCFGGSADGADAGIFTVAAGVTEWDDERIGDVQERYMREDDLSELLPEHALHTRK